MVLVILGARAHPPSDLPSTSIAGDEKDEGVVECLFALVLYGVPNLQAVNWYDSLPC